MQFLVNHPEVVVMGVMVFITLYIIAFYDLDEPIEGHEDDYF